MPRVVTPQHIYVHKHFWSSFTQTAEFAWKCCNCNIDLASKHFCKSFCRIFTTQNTLFIQKTCVLWAPSKALPHPMNTLLLETVAHCYITWHEYNCCIIQSISWLRSRSLCLSTFPWMSISINTYQIDHPRYHCHVKTSPGSALGKPCSL